MNTQCQTLLSQAKELSKKMATARDKKTIEQANNLIIAAKIDQEHFEYAQCMDKASRSVKLLDPEAELSVQYYN